MALYLINKNMKWVLNITGSRSGKAGIEVMCVELPLQSRLTEDELWRDVSQWVSKIKAGENKKKGENKVWKIPNERGSIFLKLLNDVQISNIGQKSEVLSRYMNIIVDIIDIILYIYIYIMHWCRRGCLQKFLLSSFCKYDENLLRAVSEIPAQFHNLSKRNLWSKGSKVADLSRLLGI